MKRFVREYKNLQSYEDRHGRMRYYYRKAGHKVIPLFGTPGTKEFDRSYDEAVEAVARPVAVGESTIRKGSFNDLIACYYQSHEFKSLKPITQAGYRYLIERFRNAFGRAMVRAFDQAQINKIRDSLADKPGIARPLMKRLHTLFNFAVERNFRNDNPMIGIRLPREGEGWRPLTDADIDLYLTFWKPGTLPRRAMIMLLYTGQRRLDAIKMGRQHTRQGRISVTQEKTGTRLSIKIHPVLQAELDLAPADDMLFLMHGDKPFKPNRFTDSFRSWCKAAGLPEQSSPHGVRKAAGRRLAEAGCSAKQIMAILGHKSLAECEVYIRDASQIILGDNAIDMLPQNESKTETV